MELIDQKTKRIMEGCKERAINAGLRFSEGTLEYIVTNKDLLELSPKYMIPTMYDYWVHDVEVLREKGRYELYPHNPYETVINTRPAISFYNDNNPDWMNVMIFYHVLAHIDFFQNNVYFRNTWDFDFTGQALSDKRTIAKLRSEKGRWVDYIIEFARSIDNLVGYSHELSGFDKQNTGIPPIIDFYFDVFLQQVKKVTISDYVKELDRYNKLLREHGEGAEKLFINSVKTKYPEIDAIAGKMQRGGGHQQIDLMQYILSNSPFLLREENGWVKAIIEVVRKTSLFFQPQIRTKIMNEGWASYWHESLFLADDRIKGHEVDFARTHAGVVALPRVGLNPYALGMRLFHHIEEQANKGRYTIEYNQLKNAIERKEYEKAGTDGRRFIYDLRKNLCDFLFVNTYIEQDFIDKYNLFVAGKRLNQERMVWEYYVKSRKASDYKAMMLENMYHPPYITVDVTKQNENSLYLYHHFEGKPLVNEYIANTMMGIEYLWGGPVQLETSEVVSAEPKGEMAGSDPEELEITWRRVVYTMKDKQLSKQEKE